MRFWRFIIRSIAIFWVCPQIAHADPLRVVFLDPGFAKSSLQLKIKLDEYLASALAPAGLGSPSSQPIDRTEAFSEFVRAKNPPIVITSEQNIVKHQLQSVYKSKLSLVCRHSRDYSLVLLSRKDSPPRPQPLLASSYTLDFLRDLFTQEFEKVIASARLIQTKKDMDGLMALLNSQVDWAVTSEVVFNLLVESNPASKGQVIVHKNSKKVAYPSLYIKENVFTIAQRDAILSAFRRMSDNKTGQELLELMGCESWK